MKKDVTRLWIEAGKILAVDAEVCVPCPECGHNYLRTKDTRINEVIEREMSCCSCGANNSLRLIRPVSQKS